MNIKQVDKSHYQFARYITKTRWVSVWHQVDEVLRVKPKSVLEVGPGPGILKSLLTQLGVPVVETVDIDPELNPDHVASAEELPFSDGEYDVVCAFQVLEHVPYEMSLRIFVEMARVARHKVIISVPDARPHGTCMLHISKIGSLRIPVYIPPLWRQVHRFHGEHYWELNKRGYSLNRVKEDLESSSDLVLDRTYRVKENLYHRFFVWTVKSPE